MNYWLSKFIYDMRKAAVRDAFRADPAAVVDRYPLAPDVRAAVLAGDVATLLPLVNPYLLRFYFAYRGMSDDEFIATVRACAAAR